MAEQSQSRPIFVGVDWATEFHQVLVMDEKGQVLGERKVKHSAEGLAQMCDWLLTLCPVPSSVCVAIEVPHGSVVETLLERQMTVYSINPKQLDRFRDRFSMSGAKDDRRDALVLADSLRTDRHCFRLVVTDEPRIIELREWSRMADDLAHERVRLTNRLREQLLRYYPQFLELGGDIGADWSLDLWSWIPTPARAHAIRKPSVQKILRQHRLRRLDADGVLARLRQPALTVAPGTQEAATAHIRLLVERIRVVNDQVRQCRRQLQRLIHQMSEAPEDSGESGEQRDVAIVDSMPGVGPIVLGTLLAEASRLLKARDYHALRALAGIAPVTQRSGKRRPFVHMRRGCNLRLRNALYHWARTASQNDELARTRYQALRARGHTHGRALRQLADRLLYVLMAMLRDQTTYRSAHAA